MDTLLTHGTEQVNGNTHYYTGTKVSVDNPDGLTLLNVWYYTNHWKNTANNTGGITNVYSAGSIGGLDAATENVSTYW